MVVSWEKKVRFRDRLCVLDGRLIPAGQEALERPYRGRIITLCLKCEKVVAGHIRRRGVDESRPPILVKGRGGDRYGKDQMR